MQASQIAWVNQDTLRVVTDPTGLLRIDGPGIEVNVEVFEEYTPTVTRGQVIARGLALLLQASSCLGIFVAREPESEPEFLAAESEPFPEPEPSLDVWG